MDQLRLVAVGDSPTEQHIRVFEAWLRDFPQPPGTVFTAALFNRSVEWWNAGCLAPTSSLRKYVPDASQLRGKIAVMINVATHEPGHRMSRPMSVLANEIWHTVVSFLSERGVDLGEPEKVEQSLRWARDNTHTTEGGPDE